MTIYLSVWPCTVLRTPLIQHFEQMILSFLSPIFIFAGAMETIPVDTGESEAVIVDRGAFQLGCSMDIIPVKALKSQSHLTRLTSTTCGINTKDNPCAHNETWLIYTDWTLWGTYTLVDGKDNYHCEKCGKDFHQKHGLVLQQRSHSGEHPYKWLQCGKALKWKSVRVLHQISHSDEQPYKCEQCDTTFKQKRDLVVHQISHSGKRSIQCKEHGKAFRQPSCLVTHWEIHLGDCPLVCEEWVRVYKWICTTCSIALKNTRHRFKDGAHLAAHRPGQPNYLALPIGAMWTLPKIQCLHWISLIKPWHESCGFFDNQWEVYSNT